MILCTRARVIEWEISACMCTVMRLCRIFAAGRPRRTIVTHVFDFPLVSIVLRRHIQDPFSTFSFNRIKERAYFNVLSGSSSARHNFAFGEPPICLRWY